MARDTYADLVNSGWGRKLSRSLGLPQPAPLRRYRADAALIDGPVLLLGDDPAADELAAVLLEWNCDVRRHIGDVERAAAVIGLGAALTEPGDLSPLALDIAAQLKHLRSSARVIMLSRTPDTAGDATGYATRAAVTGLIRSLAHEMRAGGTANGIQLGDGLNITAPSALAALRFLLSGRSAFVSGQFITVKNAQGVLPQDWRQPLAGEVIAVTGAARGIGAAIAHTLHRDGASVIAVDVPAAGDALAEAANSVRGTALQVDITAEDAGQKILDHAGQFYGRLDGVVHNAGITRDKLLANMSAAQWDSVLAVNLESQLRMNKIFLGSEIFTGSASGIDNPAAGKNNPAAGEASPAVGPRIVSLASTSGVAGNRGQTNYAASKAGIIGMVAGSAAELAAVRGSINAVAPGFIETAMTAKMPLLTREVARRLNSLSQGGLPVDVAETVAYLLSPAAVGTTGMTLRVCGQNMIGA